MRRRQATGTALLLLCALFIGPLSSHAQQKGKKKKGKGAPQPEPAMVEEQTPKDKSLVLNAAIMDFRGKKYASAETKLVGLLADIKAGRLKVERLDEIVRMLALCRIHQGKWKEALGPVDRYLKEYSQGVAAEEMLFWKGVCHLQEKEGEATRKAMQDYLAKYPAGARLDYARLVIALSLEIDEKFKELAKFLDPLVGKLDPAINSQATALRLHALLKAEDLDGATAMVMAFDSESRDNLTLAGFHLLSIQLGNELFKKEQPRKALQVFQRVWTLERILARQQERLAQLDDRIARLKARGDADPYDLMSLDALAARIKAEIEQLKKIPDYDTARGARIAQCFDALDRSREAYLALGDLVAKMPESELLKQSHYMMLTCLADMESWPRLIEEAKAFEKKFPDARGLLPSALYLRGEAEMRLMRFKGAGATFERTGTEFTDFAQAARCLFLSGYAYMMADQQDDAIRMLGKYLEANLGGEYAEQARYWRAMGHYYKKAYPEAREGFIAYLAKHPNGEFAVDAAYRKAHCLFNSERFAEAVPELKEFLDANPESQVADEARNALGDSLYAIGEVPQGLEVFRKVTTRIPRLYEHAVFRIAKALQTLERTPELETHLQKFIDEFPDSGRAPEAIQNLANLKRIRGESENARELYWDAIARHGNNPEAEAIESMLLTLGKYYAGPEQREALLGKLREMAAGAEKQGKHTLFARCLWLRSALLRPQNPKAADAELARVANDVDPKALPALVLIEIADSERRAGRKRKARELYKTILTWHPRSMFRDRAYLGLGLIARAENKNNEALKQFEEFEAVSTSTPLLVEVLRTRAAIYADGQEYERATGELIRILEIQGLRGRPIAEALLELGRLQMRRNDPRKAIAYFQRLYVMHGRWTDLVADAYWESGQAFEKLGMQTEARNTYQEMIDNETLKEFDAHKKATKRLRELGPAPAAAPTT